MLMHERRSLCVGEVRYLSITDESRQVGPSCLPDLSAGPVLWPFLVFGPSTAATCSVSAWTLYFLSWSRPDLRSSAPGGWPPAPTPVPEFLQHPGAAHQTDPALGSWLYSLWLEKDNDNPHTGRSSSTYSRWCTSQPKFRYYLFRNGCEGLRWGYKPNYLYLSRNSTWNHLNLKNINLTMFSPCQLL